MSRGYRPHEAQAVARAIKSVVLRTRDGQARLDRVYRCLLAAGPEPPSGGGQVRSIPRLRTDTATPVPRR
jgi:hypothetical protein